jgi:hypothetical protein
MSSTAPATPAGPDLNGLAERAEAMGLLLRLQVRDVGPLRTLRVGVARRGAEGLVLLGELKGWALPTAAGLRLDTMRVQGEGCVGVGPLIWAATFAWALEATPCRRAQLLAIRDNERQHRRLVRYFHALGFRPVRELGAGVADLAPRLVWGGAGLLMQGPCAEGLQRSLRQLELVRPG